MLTPRLVGLTVAVLAAFAALLVLGVWPLLKHQFTFPGGRLGAGEGDPGLWGLPTAEEVWLVAGDGVRLHGWWIPPAVGQRTRSADPGGPNAVEGSRDPCGAVIYFHGNANTIAPRAWLGRDLAALGLGVLLFDYRGYGLSEGRPSGEGLRKDARAAWSYMVEERGIDPERLVLFGNSLGSAVATDLALERPAAALVLGAPFPDFPTLVRHHAPWVPLRVLPWRDGRFEGGARIGELDIPVLIAIGELDRVVPPTASRSVYAAAPEPKQLVTVPAEHNTLVAHPALWRALDDLLTRRLGCRGG